MRLLHLQQCDFDSGKLTLIDTEGKRPPSYAILSHRWQSEEVLFTDIERGTTRTKRGYAKIRNAALQALQDGYLYLWIDSCCIDKSSSAELSEAINSMFRWYEESNVCYVFLSDVDLMEDLAASEWFTRGWTLQELLASRTAYFFTKKWTLIGDKVSLQYQISSITGISKEVLAVPESMVNTSIARRMSWASSRKTTRPEDMAYCLLGLFAINMPLLYGEGSRAFIRLQEEIIKGDDDFSIFAWKYHSKQARRTHGLLADEVSAFRESGDIVPYSQNNEPFAMTNKGLSITLEVTARSQAILPCIRTTQNEDRHKRLAIAIEKIRGTSSQYTRVDLTNLSACTIHGQHEAMFIPQRQRTLAYTPAPYQVFQLHLQSAQVDVIPLRSFILKHRDEARRFSSLEKAFQPSVAQGLELHALLRDDKVSQPLRVPKWEVGVLLAIKFSLHFPGSIKSHAFVDFLLGTMPDGDLGCCLQAYDPMKGSLVEVLEQSHADASEVLKAMNRKPSFVGVNHTYEMDVQISSSTSGLLNRFVKGPSSRKVLVTLVEVTPRSRYDHLPIDDSSARLLNIFVQGEF